MNDKNASARDIVVMGGATGSAQALARILAALPEDFSAAVIACVDGPVVLKEPSMAALAQTHDLPASPVPIGAYMTVPALLKMASCAERCAA